MSGAYPYCQICMSIIWREEGSFLEHTPQRATDMVNGVQVCNDHRDEQIIRCAGNPVLADILAERRAQDEEWGGPDHDDHNGLEEWLDLIARQRLRALKSDDPRDRFVKIAALAVAAIESHDRRRANV